MRFLEITTDGHLFFTEWFRRGDDVPPYAILSHTWEQGQEVTYDDWINGRAMGKKGYDKSRFLKMQCQRDGLKDFWIDTCCLIKEDPDEHHDALSSTFRWYQNATDATFFCQMFCTVSQKQGVARKWEAAGCRLSRSSNGSLESGHPKSS
jgi:hypothetical protein